MVLGSLALLALSAVLWWIGPLLAVGDWQPLVSVPARLGLLLLLWALWIARLVYAAWRRRQANATLLAGLGGPPGGQSTSDKEAQLLAQRFNEATARLKAGRGAGLGRGWSIGKDRSMLCPRDKMGGAPCGD